MKCSDVVRCEICDKAIGCTSCEITATSMAVCEDCEDDDLHMSGGSCTDRSCEKCFPAT